MQDETSAGGEHDFLARLCVDWEAAAQVQGCRSVSLRSGVVLGRNGGMIQQLIVPFWLGLGGRMGSGDQPLPWIHVKDLASLVLHCLEEDACRGVLNAVAPEVVRNREFVAEFGRAVGRPAVVPVPEFVFNLLYGEERAAMITKGQVVRPVRTLETGFTFTYPTVREALEECAHLSYTDADVYGRVQIETLKEGDGASFPQAGQKVSCHYVLTLENGRKIDSSRDRGRPFQFTLGRKEVIAGWEDGIARMSKGQRAKLTVPADLGYGPRGQGRWFQQGRIPPNATLIFDVELLTFN